MKASNGYGPTLWDWGSDLAVVSECVRSGGIVALPTESSYGLGVDPLNSSAVERVLALKRRDASVALPVVGASISQLEGLGVDLSGGSLRAALDTWPAALTVVAPLTSPVAASLGLPTLAVRVPDHGPLRRLLGEIDSPLTATSANVSGEAPLLSWEEVGDLLQIGDVVIRDGPLQGGQPSTIVADEGGRLVVLRQGRVVFPVPGPK